MRPSQRGVLQTEIVADHGRVVRVQSEMQTGFGHAGPGVFLHGRIQIRDLDVGDRAYGERDPKVDEEAGRLGILEDRDPVVDPLDSELLDVEDDGRGRTVLSLMSGEMEAGPPGEPVGREELPRVDPELRR